MHYTITPQAAQHLTQHVLGADWYLDQTKTWHRSVHHAVHIKHTADNFPDQHAEEHIQKVFCTIAGNCRQSFDSSAALTAHQQSSHLCSSCDKIFDLQSSLQLHWAVKHASPPPPNLPLTEAVQNVAPDQPMSSKIHHNEHKSEFACPGCQRVFLSVDAVFIHASSTTGKPHWYCTPCRRVFSDKEELESVSLSDLSLNIVDDCENQHKEEHLTKTFCCGQGFESADALTVHQKSSHICPNCDKKFQDEAGMLTHLKVKHPDKCPAVFVCEMACGQSFSSPVDRDKHFTVTHPICEHCRQRFLSDRALHCHLAHDEHDAKAAVEVST